VSANGGSRRAWGWHPLTDAWAARIVDAARVRPGELVLDLGAGHGALTGHLLAAGARVIAVEPHPTRAAYLRTHYDTTVLESDAVTMPLPRRPFRVVANPPYNLGTALLRRLLAPGSYLIAADLVLQRAVVARYAGGPTGKWPARAGIRLPRNAFRPPPKVDSAVIRRR